MAPFKEGYYNKQGKKLTMPAGELYRTLPLLAPLRFVSKLPLFVRVVLLRQFYNLSSLSLPALDAPYALKASVAI
jgi:hypothetical protein